jgi:hypothetical protein
LDASGTFFVTAESFLNGLDGGCLDGNPTSGLGDSIFRVRDNVHVFLLGIGDIFGVGVLLFRVRDILGILGEFQGI